MPQRTPEAQPNPRMQSQVDVAERPLGRAHEVTHGDGWAGSIAQVNRRVERRVSGWRDVKESIGARDLVFALGRVQHLPDPPGTVNHPVVEVEHGIAGRDK